MTMEEINKNSMLSFSMRKETLETVFNSLSVIVEEATITAEEYGLNFRGMDPSHVSLIDLSLDNLENYQKPERDYFFTINLKEMIRIIKTLDKNKNYN